MIIAPAPIRLEAVILSSKGFGQILSGRVGVPHRFNTRFWSLNFPLGWDWYRAQEVRGQGRKKSFEVSALEFATWTAPAKLRCYYPRLKIVIVLESPTSAIARLHPEQMTRWKGEDIHELCMTEYHLLPWDYLRWLNVWLKYFPPTQMCVIDPTGLSLAQKRLGIPFDVRSPIPPRYLRPKHDKELFDNRALKKHLGAIAARISWLN